MISGEYSSYFKPIKILDFLNSTNVFNTIEILTILPTSSKYSESNHSLFFFTNLQPATENSVKRAISFSTGCLIAGELQTQCDLKARLLLLLKDIPTHWV